MASKKPAPKSTPKPKAVAKAKVVVRATAKPVKASAKAAPRAAKPAASRAAPRPKTPVPAVRKAPAKPAPAPAPAVRSRVPAAVPAAKEARLTRKELDHFRDKLFAIREQVTGRISDLKEDSLTPRDKVITEEDGTDAFDREFSLNLASTDQDSVFEIDEALRRIEQGTFGICQVSGRPIARARLEAIPYVRLCVEAQEAAERGTPRFIDARRAGAGGSDWQDPATAAAESGDGE